MADMISAKPDGPPQCEAAPPTTAWTSINATIARLAHGSPSTTSSPAPFFTVTENLGGPAGVAPSRDFSFSGVSGGASTGLTTDLSSDIKIPQVLLSNVQTKFREMVRAAGVEPTTCGFGGRHSIQLSYARNPMPTR